jgi:cytochrome P450
MKGTVAFVLAENSSCPVAPDSIEGLLSLDDWSLDHQAEILSQLRRAGPVVWIPQLESFAVTEFKEVAEALNDTERFSSELGNPRGPHALTLMQSASRALADNREAQALLGRLVPDWRAEASLLGLDPPRHSTHRRVVNRLFTPRNVASIRPRADEIANILIDQFVGEDIVDLSAQFAVQLPLRIIAEQLGIGVDRLGDFKRWSDDFVAPLGNNRLGEIEMLSILRTLVEFGDHFRPALEERRVRPQADFLTILAEATDDAYSISDEQRLGIIASMLGAGNETSTKMLSTGCAILAERADLAELLIEQPDLISKFVDEILRLYSPVQGLFRVARHDTELGGVQIPGGAWVWMLFSSANRSESEFSSPHEIDLNRPNGSAHLAFGKGAHYCVGGALARMEGDVGFAALLSRVYPWSVVSKERDPSYVLHGYRKLVVSIPGRVSDSHGRE